MASNKSIIGALLIGVATGAVLGVLFAPDKGSKTRQKLSKKTNDLIDQLSDKMEEGKTVLTDLKKSAMGAADNIRNKVADAMEDSDTGKKTRAASHSSN